MKLAYYLEDDPQIQSTLELLFELEFPGHLAIESFASLQTLRAAFERKVPDLLIADLNVLDAGPVAICDFLERATSESLPVIVASADTQAMRRLFSGQERFRLFSKGDATERLIAMVGQVLGCTPGQASLPVATPVAAVRCLPVSLPDQLPDGRGKRCNSVSLSSGIASS